MPIEEVMAEFGVRGQRRLMAFTVRFTIAAREDLRELHAYIAAHDSPENADL